MGGADIAHGATEARQRQCTRGGRRLLPFGLQKQAIDRSRVTPGPMTPFFAGEPPILGRWEWSDPWIGGVWMTAGVACGSCGTGLREHARFCDVCGAPTAISGDTAEYKQVTVLFADVVRSMDIAAALDMERLREIMTELVERSAAVVRRYGGGTVEFTGDGVMAVFGAPVALEDHAFRACLAALAIQEEAKRLAAEVENRDGVDLRLRVGLNSGRVIAGEIGSGSLGYAAIGQQVGMAQRMESVAPPGAVMLSQSTARLVEHMVMLAEPERVRIKGADEPVARAGCWRSAHGMAWLAAPRRVWSVGAGRWRPFPPWWTARSAAAVVWWRWWGRRASARAGWRGRPRRPAAGRGVEVFWAFCESHASDIPFHAVTRLLRAGTGSLIWTARPPARRLRAQAARRRPAGSAAAR